MNKRLIRALLVFGLLAVLWGFSVGRRMRWNDLIWDESVFPGGNERRGEAYGRLAEGPGLALRAGVYTLSYAAQMDGENEIQLVTDNTVCIYPDRIALTPAHGSGTLRFTVYNEADNFRILVDYLSGSHLRVDALSLEGPVVADTPMMLTFLLLGLWILLEMRLAGRLGRTRATRIAVLGFCVLIVSAPCMKDNLGLGDDMLFHLERLGNLTQSLRSGQFPARLGTYMNAGYGAPTSIYYPELFFYLPAAMILAGTSIQYAMHALIILMNLGTAIAMFLLARRLFEDEWTGLLASVLYTLAQYRITDVYTRSALGEALAMAFMPLLALGLYEVISGKATRWPLIALCAAAILQSHLLSTAILAPLCALICLIFLPALLRERRILSLARAALFALLLSAVYLVPLLDSAGKLVSTDMMLRSVSANAMAPAQVLLNHASSLTSKMFDGRLRARAVVVGTPLMLGALAGVLALLQHPIEKKHLRLNLLFLILGSLSAFLSTAAFPWGMIEARLPAINYLQFPWRLLMLTTFFFSLLGGYGLRALGKDRPDAALFGTLALCLCFAVPLLTAETQKSSLSYYTRPHQQGLLYLDYSLAGTNLQDTHDRDIHAQGDVTFGNLGRMGTTLLLPVETREESILSLPIYGFSGYVAALDGTPMPIALGAQNRLAVSLPAGVQGMLCVRYQEPWLWKGASILSLSALLFLLGRAAFSRRRKPSAL